MRRQFVTGLLMTIAMIVILGLLYPLAMTGAAQLFAKDKANGSFVTQERKGRRLVAHRPGLHRPGRQSDPALLPVAAVGGGGRLRRAGERRKQLGAVEPEPHRQRAGGRHRHQDQPVRDPNRSLLRPGPGDRQGDTPITDKAGNPVYEKNRDGSYVCDPNTVPERVLAYRRLNGLGPKVTVPVDAVTSSASGLDPRSPLRTRGCRRPELRRPAVFRSRKSWRSSRPTRRPSTRRPRREDG